MSNLAHVGARVHDFGSKEGWHEVLRVQQAVVHYIFTNRRGDSVQATMPLEVRDFRDLAGQREALTEFRQRYNEHWILERLNYRTPAQARRDFSLELDRAAWFNDLYLPQLPCPPRPDQYTRGSSCGGF